MTEGERLIVSVESAVQLTRKVYRLLFSFLLFAGLGIGGAVLRPQPVGPPSSATASAAGTRKVFTVRLYAGSSRPE